MKVSLVVPVFNEEETIGLFYKTVREYDALKEHDIEIVFINDGSTDATESIINALAVADPLSSRSRLREILAKSRRCLPDSIMPVATPLFRWMSISVIPSKFSSPDQKMAGRSGHCAG